MKNIPKQTLMTPKVKLWRLCLNRQENAHGARAPWARPTDPLATMQHGAKAIAVCIREVECLFAGQDGGHDYHDLDVPSQHARPTGPTQFAWPAKA